MDADRFDALVRRLRLLLPGRTTRRVAAGLGLAALLGPLVPGDANARRRCGRCRRRRNGECLPRRDGRACAECKTCRNGRCQAPRPDGTACGACKACQTGRCVEQSSCPNVGRRCDNGASACFCEATVAGTSFCAAALLPATPCASDAACVTALGPGARCIQCGDGRGSDCALPCPNPV